jgi:hypothetical protein
MMTRKPLPPAAKSLRDVNSMIKDQRGRNMAARDAVKSTRSGIKSQRASLQSPGYKDGGMVKTGRAQISGMKFNGTF